MSRGHLEEKGEAEGKKSESPLTLDSLSWTPDFAEMYVCFHPYLKVIMSTECKIDTDMVVHHEECMKRPSSLSNLRPWTRPSSSQATDADIVNQGPRPNLLPKLAISAESEGDETSGLGDPSKTSFSIAELPQDEHDATTPGSTHSGATLSGMNFVLSMMTPGPRNTVSAITVQLYSSTFKLYFLCLKPLQYLGSFSEHLDQLTPRGEGVESPEAPSHASADQHGQTNPGQNKSAAEKAGAVPKVPKSVSAGALSLMIPGGELKNLCIHSFIRMRKQKLFVKGQSVSE